MANKRCNSDVLKSPSDTEFVKKRITRQTMKRCNVCTEQISLDFVGEENVTVMCRKCSDRYHCNCVGITSQFFYNLIQNSKKGWLCYGCAQDSFKFVERLEERIDELERQIQINTHNIKQTTSTIERSLVAMDEKVISITESLMEEIQTIKNQITRDNLTMDNEEIVKTVTEAALKNLQCPPRSIRQNNDMKYIHALQRKNNLVIHNVPNEPHESKDSLTGKILKVCSALGVETHSQNISIAIRLNKRQTQNTSTTSNTQHQIPAILVKFCDSAIKDEIFDAYIAKITNKAPLTQQAIGYRSMQRIYVNHHLSPELANLKKKAIDLKKQGKISKVNARYNTIRINVNNKWFKVDSPEALDEIFEINNASEMEL